MKMKRILIICLVFVMSTSFLEGCSAVVPEPTATVIQIPTYTLTKTTTIVPTITPTKEPNLILLKSTVPIETELTEEGYLFQKISDALGWNLTVLDECPPEGGRWNGFLQYEKSGKKCFFTFFEEKAWTAQEFPENSINSFLILIALYEQPTADEINSQDYWNTAEWVMVQTYISINKQNWGVLESELQVDRVLDILGEIYDLAPVVGVLVVYPLNKQETENLHAFD